MHSLLDCQGESETFLRKRPGTPWQQEIVSGNSQDLMSLNTETPLGVAQTVANGQIGIEQSVRTVHRLQEVVIKRQMLDGFRKQTGLGIDKFEFIAGLLDERGACLGADAEPVDLVGACRYCDRPVRLDGDFEIEGMQGGDKGFVQLEKGFAAGADDEATARSRVAGPLGFNGGGELTGAGKFAAGGAVRSDKVGIAKLADGGGAVGFSARPEVAAGEAAEDGGAAGLGAFALQGVEDFFNRVAH